MHKIDDEKIKSIIKKHQSDPQIRLTASEVLHTYEVRQAQKLKMRHEKKKIWWFVPSTFSLAAGLTAAIIFVMQPQGEGSSVISESSIVYQAEIPGGKDGEFIFMTASALAFSDTDNLALIFNPDLAKANNSTSTNFSTIEETLDYTMPLVETFTQASSGLDFTVDEGEFVGEYATYQYQIQLNNELYVFCNTTFDKDDQEETETEISGELHTGTRVYQVDGEKEVDLTDSETDLKINVHLSNTRTIAIQSENENHEQKFSYSELENDELISEVEIKAEVEEGQYSLSVQAKQGGNQHQFEIQVQNSNSYRVLTDDETIEVTVTGHHRYTYQHMGPHN